jgi:DNA transformation protein
MSGQDAFIEHLLDLLYGWAPVAARRMFGGHGLFRGGIMFALVSDETLYLKTDDGNHPMHEAADMAPFRYARAGKSVALGFHAVPPELLEEGEALARWADAAWEAALRGRRKSRPRRPRAKAP